MRRQLASRLRWAAVSTLLVLVGCSAPAAQSPPGAGTPEEPTPSVSRSDGRVALYRGERRLPYPEQDERIEGHLPPLRLADRDTFENPIDPADIPETVPWEEAAQYLGHTITVQGRIVNIGQTRSGSVFFLNFDPDWRGKFYLVVFDDLADTLEVGVEGTFLGKLVRVRGLVEPHNRRPQIKILSMEQVEFVPE